MHDEHSWNKIHTHYYNDISAYLTIQLRLVAFLNFFIAIRWNESSDRILIQSRCVFFRYLPGDLSSSFLCSFFRFFELETFKERNALFFYLEAKHSATTTCIIQQTTTTITNNNDVDNNNDKDNNNNEGDDHNDNNNKNNLFQYVEMNPIRTGSLTCH